LVLEILGDQRIPYEGELKRFRSEGDFLIRGLTDLVSQCRSQIHQLEHEFEELEELVGEREDSARRPSSGASYGSSAKGHWP